MPKIKTVRDDILRTHEIMETIKRAKEAGPPWLPCALSLAIIFGKRVNEVMSLTKEQIIFDEHFLIVRFRVGKKREGQQPIPTFFIKRKTRLNPLIPYIREYTDNIASGYLFPSSRHTQTWKQKRVIKLKNGESKELEYTYTRPGGYISPDLARYYLKIVAPSWWWHLCRESLATTMAEEGATEEELMHWFDWETPNSPHKYVKRGSKLTEKWSERIW
jgi:integrase